MENKKTEREFRSLNLELRALKDKECSVEGYAATFDEYVLFSCDGVDYKEKILPDAFKETDFSDVVFRIDHKGPVFARTKAGTIELNVDNRGLHHVTDLSKTTNSRNLFEDIEAGNYPQMSFAFTVREDSYDRETHTRIIHKISKVYDISPVSFPANPETELFVRDYFNGVIEAEKAERLEAEQRAKDKERRDSLRAKLINQKLKGIKG